MAPELWIQTFRDQVVREKINLAKKDKLSKIFIYGSLAGSWLFFFLYYIWYMLRWLCTQHTALLLYQLAS